MSTNGDLQHNYPALVFGILLITVIICGNVLVCLSVYKEKALKTTTNYFIVSLAVADLLLAVLVLPLFVYSEFQGVWSLNVVVCDWLMAMDVMLCTASIFNLCAISIDRFPCFHTFRQELFLQVSTGPPLLISKSTLNRELQTMKQSMKPASGPCPSVLSFGHNSFPLDLEFLPLLVDLYDHVALIK